MLKILALTSIRSDYDLMSGLYSMLNADPDVDLKMLVSGAHLSRMHGFTVENIKEDKLPILAEIETLISADSLSSRLKTASCLLSSAIDIVKQFEPDVIIYAGDREDVLIGGMLGGFLGIPTIHFFGGDHAADGHIDNAVRHATSKLSSMHFVSIAEHKERLIRLGESEKRIFVVGSVALDKFLDEPVIDRKELIDSICIKPHAAKCNRWAVLIFHPIEDEKEAAGQYISNAVNALIDRGYHVLMGASNTDPGNFYLGEVLGTLAEKEQVTFYKNICRAHFVNLLRNAELVIGNSSAGILESASIPLPAINIGSRQKGRLTGKNVIFCEGEYADISLAIEIAESSSFTKNLSGIINPYGDGRSVNRAYELIKTLDFSKFTSKPEDPGNAKRQ